jgi:hypothetical protein
VGKQLKKELAQEKKIQIATNASRVVELIQDARFKNRLPIPLLHDERDYNDFYNVDDFDVICSKLQTKAARDNFKRMAWTGIKYGLLELEDSDASIGETGFKSIVVPDNYRRRVGRFLSPPKPAIKDMKSHRIDRNNQMQLRFS